MVGNGLENLSRAFRGFHAIVDHRIRLAPAIAVLGQCIARHIGANGTRQNIGDMDIVQLFRFGPQRIHIADQPVLGRAIGGAQGNAHPAGDRTDSDDMPAACLDHVGEQ